MMYENSTHSEKNAKMEYIFGSEMYLIGLLAINFAFNLIRL